MIDINTIINNAIQQEVSKIITDFIDPYIANMKREYQQQIASMREEVEQLKQQRAVSPATGSDVVVGNGDTLKLLRDSAAVRQAVYDIAYEAGQALLNEHTEEYDHEEYDRAVRFIDEDLPSDFPDFDDFVRHEDLGSVIEDKLNGASISISI